MFWLESTQCLFLWLWAITGVINHCPSSAMWLRCETWWSRDIDSHVYGTTWHRGTGKHSCSCRGHSILFRTWLGRSVLHFCRCLSSETEWHVSAEGRGRVVTSKPSSVSSKNFFNCLTALLVDLTVFDFRWLLIKSSISLDETATWRSVDDIISSALPTVLEQTIDRVKNFSWQ